MTEFVLDTSESTAFLKRSVMRELLGLAVDPEIISLAGGLPPNELIPTQLFSECLQRVITNDGPRSLQYSPQYKPLKDWIVEHMRQRGVRCELDQVFITNGAQQGLTILSNLFLDRGQPAIIEQATFTGIQQVTSGRGALVRTIPTDLATGADMIAYEAALDQYPQPKLGVLIPDFHNPLGVSLTKEKRQRAAQLAARYQVPLIEDDPYSSLRFRGEELPPIKAYDETGIVFYLGSFSKMLAPAVRLGWIVASPALAPLITAIRESLDLESSTLMQRAVADFLQRGYLEPHLEELKLLNLERLNALLTALEMELGDLVQWTRPEGGLFVWVSLPLEIDTWEMFPDAIKSKVAYIPGTAFAVDGGMRNTMRLNFSNARPDKIREAVRRLSRVIRRKRS
jgi:2-aminoadipate transaminase